MALRYKTAHAQSAVFAAITFIFIGWKDKAGHCRQSGIGGVL